MESINAIDLGSTKTVCLIADLESNHVARVVGVGVADSRGMKRGTVVDIDSTSQSIVSAVRKAETMSDRKVDNVIASISGDHISCIAGKGIIPIVAPRREITREDVNRVINHSKQIGLPPDRELIHAVPGHYRVDGQDGVSRPVGMSAERLEVRTLLVSGHTAHIQTLESCFKRSQIELENLVLSQLATALSVLEERESGASVAVVDIGGNVTEYSVTLDGELVATGILPVGSAHVTSDISQLLKVSLEEAERVKLKYGNALADEISEKETFPVNQLGAEKPRPFSRKVFTEIIQARMREIVSLVRKDLIDKGLLNALSNGFVLTGGGSKLPGCAELVTREFGDVAVRKARPADLPGLGDMVAGEEFASAVGLIRYGLKCRQDEAVEAEVRGGRGILGRLGEFFGPRTK